MLEIPTHWTYCYDANAACGLCTPSMAYDAERDLIFYQKPAQSGFVVLKAGDFAIVPPEDAHAPRRQATSCGCPVKKIVVKIKV